MKRFYLFAGDDYYPERGLGDYVGAYETEDEAKAAHHERGDWAVVFEATPDGLAVKCTRVLAHTDVWTEWYTPENPGGEA